MENNKKRVLAYTLARELDKEDLVEVSGGAAQLTTKTTLRATGFSGCEADVVTDYTVDW